ncbi:MAG TPA: ABC transporter permease [Candidatus Limnocylindrales bacterium]|nr:ABC transporter permease [Candidatus Limnocylindrales bacterium]
MIRYLLRRLLQAVLLLVAVSVLLFGLMQTAPGDYLSEQRLTGQLSPESLRALRAQYGLDQPLAVRYARWLVSVGKGEFGYSFAYNVPASQLLLPRVRNTLLLTLPALFLSWLIGVPAGVLAASRRGGWFDRLFSGGNTLLLALPDVLLGLVALFIALRTHIFPAGGMTSMDLNDATAMARIPDLLWHLALPVSVLVLGSLAPIMLHVRSSVAEVMESSYFRAAEGHGLRRFRLLFCHALPAAANPLISLFGLSFAFLLSTSLVVEVILSWPGIGPMLLEAVLARDLFVVLGAAIFSTIFLVAGNLVADILLYAFDPRIRVQS